MSTEPATGRGRRGLQAAGPGGGRGQQVARPGAGQGQQAAGPSSRGGRGWKAARPGGGRGRSWAAMGSRPEANARKLAPSRMQRWSRQVQVIRPLGEAGLARPESASAGHPAAGGNRRPTMEQAGTAAPGGDGVGGGAGGDTALRAAKRKTVREAAGSGRGYSRRGRRSMRPGSRSRREDCRRTRARCAEGQRGRWPGQRDVGLSVTPGAGEAQSVAARAESAAEWRDSGKERAGWRRRRGPAGMRRRCGAACRSEAAYMQF